MRYKKARGYICLVLVLISLPMILANSIGENFNVDVTTEDFSPIIWICDSRAVLDDNIEPGRMCNPSPTCPPTIDCVTNRNSSCCAIPTCNWSQNVSSYNLEGKYLWERINNYAFEGEKIVFDVLVFDKNGIDKVEDVYGTIGTKRSGSRPTIIKTNKTISFCDSTGTRFVPWSYNLELSKFNPSLGNLVKVSLNANIFMDINSTFENVDPFTGANYSIIYTGGNVALAVPEQNIEILNNGFITTGYVGPYDGLTDFDGISGDSFDVNNISSINFNGNNLSLYKANSPGENLIIPATSSGSAIISGLANFDGGVRTMSGANVCIEYTYEIEEIVSGETSNIEVNCIRDRVIPDIEIIDPSCNAKIEEEILTNVSDNTAAYYKCIFTVETPESMYGKYWITVEAIDHDGLNGAMEENEYWFLNPIVALSVDGEMNFDTIKPGTSSYSDTILIGNDAEKSSGVMMDMFISGTDFYDSESSGAKCPTTNPLSLGAFRYFATNGAYSTKKDQQIDLVDGAYNPLTNLEGRNIDGSGYVNIDYGIGLNNPKKFYDNMEIIQSNSKYGPYYLGNLLAPNAKMAITFKLNLPEPCNGDFDSGSIYFWGEAV